MAQSSNFIKVDGSQGEGGGQILRTAISLSAITGKPVEVSDIRAKRPKPGLQPQHIAAISAVASLFDAEVEGLRAGSDRIRFSPREFSSDFLKLDVGTAGSIPMVLMTAIPAVSLSGRRAEIEIIGGTDVRNSPTTDYLKYIVAEAYRSIGIKFSVEISKRGYYPKGGGIVRVGIEPCQNPGVLDLQSLRKIEPKIASVCCQLPKHVAERQVSSALLKLEKSGVHCSNYSASFEVSLSPGCSVLVYSVSDFGPFIGGDSIGEVGKRAEDIGEQAAERFLESYRAGATVDSFLADMLVLPLAMTKGKSTFRTSKATTHLRTNLDVVHKILDCKYGIEQSESLQVVSIEGQ